MAEPSYDPLLRWLAVQEGATELQREHPDWRRGQALFNALRMMHPSLAEQIRGTSADPFYNDDRERVQAFAKAVMDLSTTPETPWCDCGLRPEHLHDEDGVPYDPRVRTTPGRATS